MIIAKVIGSAIATLKDKRLETRKLLLVSPANVKGEAIGDPMIAVDLVGSGEGEVVFVVQWSTARVAVGTSDTPADAAIVGILDSMSVEGRKTFLKE